MPAPTTTGVNMGYPSTVDSGIVAPAIIGSESAGLSGGIALTLTGPGNVFLYAFEVQGSMPVHQVRWHMGATTTGHTNMAIYTAAGNIVTGSDTGAILNVASTTQTQTYSTDVQLGPGQYFLAIACDNTTDTYAGVAGATAKTPMTRHRIGTNTLSGGAMPLTLGTITNSPNPAPCIALIPTGSLIG